MDIKNLEKAAELEEFAGYLAGLQQPAHHEHGADGSIETLREDEYEGHRITIKTTYTIEVDGKVLQAPLALDNDGNLHCHSLPNYQFSSAINMVKTLIDNFPDDFKRKKSSSSSKKSAGSSKKSAGHGSHGAHKSAAKKGGK